MRRATLLFALLLAACGPARQPETVAAFEVPLPTAEDKTGFLNLLRSVAETHGYHLDAASPADLRQLSEVSPMTLHAAVWRGDDAEVVASAMDFKDHLGRIWLTFDKGEVPRPFRDFQNELMPKVRMRWPNTTSLPIMPTGAIPLARDLVRTPGGYVVRTSARSRYGLSPTVAPNVR